MATVDLTTKFLPKVDEQFTAESKRSLVTNQDFTWDGAATVRVYKVSTGKMNDYARNGDPATGSRFGEVEQLNATTYPLTIEKDRSFTFVIDKLDEDETKQQLSGRNRSGPPEPRGGYPRSGRVHLWCYVHQRRHKARSRGADCR